jgi:hypothetical protein
VKAKTSTGPGTGELLPGNKNISPSYFSTSRSCQPTYLETVRSSVPGLAEPSSVSDPRRMTYFLSASAGCQLHVGIVAGSFDRVLWARVEYDRGRREKFCVRSRWSANVQQLSPEVGELQGRLRVLRSDIEWFFGMCDSIFSDKALSSEGCARRGS